MSRLKRKEGSCIIRERENLDRPIPSNEIDQ